MTSIGFLSALPPQPPGTLQGAASELVGLPGVWAAVRYCARLGRGGQRASLVLDFSQWILTADPENGIEMFMEMDPPLSPSKVCPSATPPSFPVSTFPSRCP